MKTQRRTGVLWLALYLIFALAPLSLMLFGERPMGREFEREISVALGFTGIGLMTLHFAMTARIRALKEPFGSDVVYAFHRRMGYITLALWLAHPIILFLRFEWALGLLNVLEAPWRARWGVFSVVALLALVVWAVLRRRLRTEYTLWRVSHGVLALAAMAMVMTHAYMVGRYVGTPLKQGLWIAYGAISLLLVGYLRVWKPWQMLRRPYRVVEVRPEQGNVYTLAVEPVGHAGLRFEPGQFAWITARHSPYASQEHPFSFASSAEQQGRIEFSIKELGDFTATVKDLPPGEPVYVDGPYGALSPDRHTDADAIVLIAGGVGIAPMMSILHTWADRGDPRPVTLLYGSPEWEGVAYRDELERLQGAINLQVVHVLERPPADWEGERGYITREILERHLPGRDTRFRVYLCGPLPMLTFVSRALREAGVPDDRVELERFDLV